MSAQQLRGASGAVYDLGNERPGGAVRLRAEYNGLLARYGGLKPALVAIASMLDVAEVGAREGRQPAVVAKLLEAVEAFE